MSRKSLIMLGVLIGSVIGGYLPVMFGADLLSFTSIIFNGVGGLIGFLVVYKLTEGF